MAWQPLTPDIAAALPKAVRHWALIQTSVTAEIERVTGAPLSVALIRQEDAALLPDEQGLLKADRPNADIPGEETSDPGMPDPGTGPATVREVVLWAAGAPRVVARTVFTAPRLREDEALRTLGERSLGALLFAGPGVSPFTQRELTRIDSGLPVLYGLITRHHAPTAPFYWARRTLFRLHDAPILCTEVFLPELLAATEVALPRG